MNNPITNEDIKKALIGLEGFKLECIEAWYSPKSILAAIGSKDSEKYPELKVIRAHSSKGLFELHPTPDNKIEIKCYCFFQNTFDKGTVELSDLKSSLEKLKDHYCPDRPNDKTLLFFDKKPYDETATFSSDQDFYGYAWIGHCYCIENRHGEILIGDGLSKDLETTKTFCRIANIAYAEGRLSLKNDLFKFFGRKPL